MEETGTTFEYYGSSQRKLGRIGEIFSEEQAERTAGDIRELKDGMIIEGRAKQNLRIMSMSNTVEIRQARGVFS